jgi:predicted nucleic acid-binding protein
LTSYVLDASVAAKWFLPPEREPFFDKAEGVLRRFRSGDCRLLVPDLFWSELGNILWKAVRVGRIPGASCEAAVQALEHVGIATFPCFPLLKDAIALALAFDRTVYDALYVALAVVSDVPLLTADERLANALAVRFPVRWLGSI